MFVPHPDCCAVSANVSALLNDTCGSNKHRTTASPGSNTNIEGAQALAHRRQGPETSFERVEAMQTSARRLQEELTILIEGLDNLKESMHAVESLRGDRHPDKMRKEVLDTLRDQTSGLEEMRNCLEAFPRRWAKFEVNTCQRKALMVAVKARHLVDDRGR
mmetsp:Transcript_54323/g.115966  ORF Transcript_54323/g.115966 Transcript_54323/m.115966 type:complete len:161 (-) Transcript_54323:49-531(-)